MAIDITRNWGRGLRIARIFEGRLAASLPRAGNSVFLGGTNVL